MFAHPYVTAFARGSARVDFYSSILYIAPLQNQDPGRYTVFYSNRRRALRVMRSPRAGAVAHRPVYRLRRLGFINSVGNQLLQLSGRPATVRAGAAGRASSAITAALLYLLENDAVKRNQSF
ncbi:hypothetical protein EVAR_55885_1 [Eumeta japonica]|uniref:Uncharacterized protein n=1 Tax=Eumeta variegata TaxID=151549 RepID=A0A4C1YH21_EUMVA|nr:hypothetical protein EVAR_55885_1 [Eumeta japonica]